MRILIISNWLPPITAGSAYYAENVAKYIKKKNNIVKVVTVDWDLPEKNFSFDVEKIQAIKVPRLPLFFQMQHMGITVSPKNIVILSNIIQEFQPDIIHHINHIFDSLFLATRVAKRYKIPVITSVTTPIMHQNPIKHKIMQLVDSFLIGNIWMNNVNGVISVDRSIDKYINVTYKTRSINEVITFAPVLDIPPSSLSYIERYENKTILFVGHIHPFRDPSSLIKSMPDLLKSIPGLKLKCIGDIQMQGPVRLAKKLNLYNKSVFFLGRKDRDYVLNELDRGTLCVSWASARYKSLGTAPREAMLMGLPVVADIPINLLGDDILKDGENIHIIDSTDGISIRKTIINILTDEKKYQQLSENTKDFAIKFFNWDNIADELLNYYKMVITNYKY